MPPLSILTLALLGGFVFVTQWYPLRYYSFRSESYRLVFTASIAAAILLFVASVITYFAHPTFIGQWVDEMWHRFVPLEHSGKATIAFLLGSSLWYPFNGLGRWFPSLSDSAAVDREIQHKQDPLEILLRRALGSGRMISVTVKNGKVYIGRLHVTFNPAFPMESISLLLSYSGHREKDSQKMVIDLNYEETHRQIKQRVEQRFKEELAKALQGNPTASDAELLAIARAEVSKEIDIYNYEIVIRISEVQSVNFFDKSIYDQYFTAQNLERDAANGTQTAPSSVEEQPGAPVT